VTESIVETRPKIYRWYLSIPLVQIERRGFSSITYHRHRRELAAPLFLEALAHESLRGRIKCAIATDSGSDGGERATVEDGGARNGVRRKGFPVGSCRLCRNVWVLVSDRW